MTREGETGFIGHKDGGYGEGCRDQGAQALKACHKAGMYGEGC